LEQSAKQAQRLADAFGVTVPSIKPKTASSSHNAGLFCYILYSFMRMFCGGWRSILQRISLHR
jgi:hypothetical protein